MSSGNGGRSALFCSLVRSLQDHIRDATPGALRLRMRPLSAPLPPLQQQHRSPPQLPPNMSPPIAGVVGPPQQPNPIPPLLQAAVEQQQNNRGEGAQQLLGRRDVKSLIVMGSPASPPQGPALAPSDAERCADSFSCDLSRDGIFPRSAAFYSPILVNMGNTCTSQSINEAILVVLQWMPSSTSISPAGIAAMEAVPRHSALKFKFFVESFGSLADLLTADYFEAVSLIGAIDVLTHIMRDDAARSVPQATLGFLVETLFISLRPRPKVGSPLAQALFRHAYDQSTTLLWRCSPFCLPQITKQLTDVLSGSPPDDGVSVLQALDGVRMNVSSPEFVEQSVAFGAALMQQVKHPKRLVTRFAQLNLMRSFFLSADCSSAERLKDLGRGVCKKLFDLLKKFGDDIEPHVMPVLAVIVTRCGLDELLEALDSRVRKAVVVPKKKDWCLSCTIALLRGSFVEVPPCWSPVPLPPPARPTAAHCSTDAGKRARLLDLALTIFTNKTGPPRGPEQVGGLAELIHLVAVHDAKFCVESVLGPLVDAPPVFLLLVGLRGLCQVIQSDSVWEQRGQYPKDSLMQLFKKTLFRSLDVCNASAALSQPGDGIDSFPVTRASGSLVPNITLPSSDETPTAEALRESVQRWHNVVFLTAKKRDSDFDSSVRRISSDVQSAVESWFAATGISPLLAESCATPRMLATPRARPRRARADADVFLLCREFLSCLAVVPELAAEQLAGKHTIGIGLLSDEEDVVNATAHSIEAMIVDIPFLRPVVLMNIVKFLEDCDLRRGHVPTLLVHLLSFLDLWVTCLFNTAIPRPSSLLDDAQVSQTEAVLLVCMCHNHPGVLLTCLRILSVLPLLTAEPEKTLWGQHIVPHAADISEAAKLAFLRHASPTGTLPANAAKLVKDRNLGFEEIAAASNVFPHLWGCLLECIGKFVAATYLADRTTISSLRTQLFKKLAFFDLSDPVTQRSSSFLMWKNMVILLVSTCETNVAGDTLFDVGGELSAFIGGLWERLADDNAELLDAIVGICCQAHFKVVPLLVTTLLLWWRGVSESSKISDKRKASIFVDVIAILRSISESERFADVLKLCPEFLRDVIPLFEQFPSSMQQAGKVLELPGGAPAKRGSAFGLSIPLLADTRDARALPFARFVVNFARLARNVCVVVERPPSLIPDPVHVLVIRAIDPAVWKVELRRGLLEKLIFWSTGDLGAGEKRSDTFGVFGQVRAASKLAAEALVRLGPLTTTSTEIIPRKIIEWAMESEASGSAVLKWIIAFHFDRVFTQFLSEVYSSKGGIVSASLIDAIYEHFFHVGSLPPTGQCVPDAEADKAVAEVVSRDLSVYGGTLLHLCLRNLGNSSREIRSRSFEVIAALAPSGFHGVPASTSDDAVHLRLLCHRGGILTRAYDSRAFEISDIASSCCASWTLVIFAQAFGTVAHMSLLQKLWALRYLTPWCDNVLLTEAALKACDVNVEAFVEVAFRDFTVDLLAAGHTAETCAFWERLAKKSPAVNGPVIVNFLLKAAAQEERHIPVVNSVLLHLFRTVGDVVPQILVQKLSFGYVSVSPQYSLEYVISSITVREVSMSVPHNPRSSAPSSRSRSCEVVASFLGDLVSANFRGMVKHLPGILIHTMLYHAAATEFRRLLSSILDGILVEYEQSGRKATKQYSALESVSAVLSSDSSDLVFAASASASASAGGCVAVEDVVRCICDYLSVMDQQVIDDWASEVFLWAIGSKERPNPARDAKAVHVLRSVALYVGLPEPRMVHELSCCIRDSLESMDASRSDPRREFPVAETCVKVEEILLLYRAYAGSLTGDAFRPMMLLMMWSAFACAVHPCASVFSMHATAVSLLSAFQDVGFLSTFQIGDIQPFVPMLHRYGYNAQFLGIQRVLFRGLLYPSCHEAAVSRIVSLVGIRVPFAPSSAISPLPDASRDALGVLGLLPWFHSTMTFVKRRLCTPDALHVAGVLAGRLGLSELKCPKSIEMLSAIASSPGDICAETAVTAIIAELQGTVLPSVALDCVEIWSEMIRLGYPSIAESALELVACLFEQLATSTSFSSLFHVLLGGILQQVMSGGPLSVSATRTVGRLLAMPSPSNGDGQQQQQPQQQAGDQLSLPPSSKVANVALRIFEDSIGRGKHPKELFKRHSQKLRDVQAATQLSPTRSAAVPVSPQAADLPPPPPHPHVSDSDMLTLLSGSSAAVSSLIPTPQMCVQVPPKISPPEPAEICITTPDTSKGDSSPPCAAAPSSVNELLLPEAASGAVAGVPAASEPKTPVESEAAVEARSKHHIVLALSRRSSKDDLSVPILAVETTVSPSMH